MTTKEQERQPLASFAFRDSDVVPDGFLKKGDKEGATLSGEPNMTVEDLAFKGYVRLWDNRTGREILQPRWILWQTAQIKRPDGSFMFTDRDPGIQPHYGLDLVCLLHPDSPDYELLKDRGFNPCYKKHTPTKVALNDHMRLSHKRAYAAMKEVMDERRREEDRTLQQDAIKSNQELIRAMAEQVGGKKIVSTPEASLYLSPNPKPPKARKKRTAKR